ncbi:hypothetical protein ES703_65913 [subsurface metagenome]
MGPGELAAIEDAVLRLGQKKTASVWDQDKHSHEGLYEKIIANRLSLRNLPVFNEFWLQNDGTDPSIDPAKWLSTVGGTGTIVGDVNVQPAHGFEYPMANLTTGAGAGSFCTLASKPWFLCRPNYFIQGDEWVEKFCLEFHTRIVTTLGVDENDFIMGLTPSRTGLRTDNNVIGVIIAGGEWRALCDWDGVETIDAGVWDSPLELITAPRRWRIEVGQNTVKFFKNNMVTPKVTMTAVAPGKLQHINFSIGENAIATSSLYVYGVRAWYEEKSEA